MTRVAAGLLLGMGLFVSWLAPSPVLSSPAPGQQGEMPRASLPRSIVGFLPLEIARVQRDADYTKDQNAYFNPIFGLVTLGLGLSLIAIWIFGVDFVLKFRGDPLPPRIRTRLDHLDAVKLSVVASARASKTCKRDFELIAEKQAYDELAAAADAVLDKIRQDLRLNSIDEAFLVPKLEDLIDRGRSLSFQLRRIAPVQTTQADRAAILQFGWASFYRINRGWERVFAGQSKLTTIQQLSALRWPLWSRLEDLPR